MAKDDIVVINQPGLEQRTSSSGKVRYVMTMRTEPVAFNLDPKQIGANVTAAIVQHLRAAVEGISQQASAATLKARKVAAKALPEGKPWAMRRYMGGRTVNTGPNQSDRAFNDSGRFAKSIVGSAGSDGNFRVNVAANRLTDKDSGGAARIFQRLVQLVPEFGDPSLLLQNDIVRKGIEKARDGIVKKLPETGGEGFKQALELVRRTMEVVEQFGELLAG